MFIVIEGLDGSGQSTQAQLLTEYLHGISPTIHTKEPTNNLIGGLIRAQLTGEWKTSQECLQLLFAADRAHHLERFIMPALEKGKNVVCDRYLFSSLAFGGVNADDKWLWHLNEHFLLPDHAFFLDVRPEECMRRMKDRPELELFEKKEYLSNVRRNYSAMAKRFKNFHIVNGEQRKDVVLTEILSKLEGK